jgi:hypothetical protein
MKSKPRGLAKAWFAAGAIGGAAAALEFVVFYAAMQIQTGGISVDFMAVAPMAVMVAIPLFLVGVAVIGLPLLLMIDGTGLRAPAAAAGIGAVVTTATALLICLAVGGPTGLALATAGFMIVPGALSGWTLCRLAYGPAAVNP